MSNIFRVIKNLVAKKPTKPKPQPVVKATPQIKEKEEPIMGFNDFLKMQRQEVKDYILESHPDVETFLTIHNPKKIIPTPGKLIIHTFDDYRMEITNLGTQGRRIRITDKRSIEIFNEVTKLPKKP